MESKSIFICASSKDKTLFWKFTQSETGQLDYFGKVENPQIKELQKIEGSTYFSSSYYTYLPGILDSAISVYLPELPDQLEPDTYSYLTHIGALLVAIEANDGLLAAELINRRQNIFNNFLQLTQYILKPIAVQALFAWKFGRFTKYEDEEDTENCDTQKLFYNISESELKKAGNPNVDETLEQMFVRYFATHTDTELTIGIVGKYFHTWEEGISELNELIIQQKGDDFIDGTSKVHNAKIKLYSNLKILAQAEPYNPHDKNAIAVTLENISKKIEGESSLEKAGYIRATGAEILRTAKSTKYNYNAKLARIGDTQDGSTGVVVRITV